MDDPRAERRAGPHELPTMCLIVITTMISTSVSAVAGGLLYLESLDALEKTVEEVGTSQTTRVVDYLAQSYIDHKLLAEVYLNALRTWRTFPTSEEEARNLFYYTGYGYVKNQPRTMGIALRIVPDVGTRDELLQSPPNLDGLLANPNSTSMVWLRMLKADRSVEYSAAEYIPRYYNRESCGCNAKCDLPIGHADRAPAPPAHCNMVHEVDMETGKMGRNIFNYTDTNFQGGTLVKYEKTRDPVTGERKAVGYWTPSTPFMASDGTAIMYGAYRAILPPGPPRTTKNPFFQGKVASVHMFVSYDFWQQYLNSIETGNTGELFVAAHMDNSVNSTVLAANTDGRGSKREHFLESGCKRADSHKAMLEGRPNPCAVLIRDLGGDIANAAVKLNATEAPFVKSDGWFMQKRLIYNDTEHQLKPVYLLWVRPVSSVEGKMQESLVMFIICVAIILFFDLFIAVAEIVMIARPLVALRRNMSLVDDMRLQETLDHLDQSLSKAVGLKEIIALTRRFHSTVLALVEYRSYLPQAVLQEISQGHAKPVDPPRGQVALCFTDIVGSTKLWETSAETMEEALDVHNSIIRGQIAQYNGYEVKTIGDAFMVSFGSPADAVLCAASIQQRLVEASWPEEPAFSNVSTYWAPQNDNKGRKVWGGIAVRIGVSYGEVTDETNPMTNRVDYRGKAVNLAARLESSAPHGAVQVSADCLSAAIATDGVRMQSLRTPFPVAETQLKGIGSVKTRIVMAPGLAQRVPYLQGVALPGGVTNVMGRQDSMSQSTASRQQTFLSSTESSDPSGGSSSGKAHQLGISGRHSTVFSSTRRKQTVARDRFGLKLSAKLGTVALVSRLDGGSRLASFDTSSETAALMTRVVNAGLSSCAATAARTRGKLGAVIGATACVSWNVISVCVTHQSCALSFAAILTTASADVRFDGAIGIASGSLLQGNVGTTRYRFHTEVGLVILSAEAACAAAFATGARCLACYIPRMPPAIAKHMRPVDSWGIPYGTEQSGEKGTTAVTLEQPDLPAFVTQKDELDDDDDLDSNGAGEKEAAAFRALFARALESASEEALQAIEARAAAAPGDSVLGGVAARLRQHAQAHPEGARYRVAAPFSAGVVQRGAAGGNSDASPVSATGVRMQMYNVDGTPRARGAWTGTNPLEAGGRSSPQHSPPGSPQGLLPVSQ